MTPAEARLFEVACLRVRELSELASTDWWQGWIAYLDHVRVRVPEVLVPRRTRRWRWMAKPMADIVRFRAKKVRRA